MDRAEAVGVREIAVFTAASETFNRKNINASIDGVVRAVRAGHRAREAGRDAGARLRLLRLRVPVRGAGRSRGGRRASPPGSSSRGATRSPSATPSASASRRRSPRSSAGRRRRACRFPRLALHFHDTRGTALANVAEGLRLGVRIFDSSAGGLGGCPYAPGAAGNVATEDLLYLLHGMGFETGRTFAKVAGGVACPLAIRRGEPRSRARGRPCERRRGPRS